MNRNLDKRVELMVPIEDDACRERLIAILDTHMRDCVKGWELCKNGAYCRRKPKKTGQKSSQEQLYNLAVKASEDARKRRPTALEPHLPPETD